MAVDNLKLGYIVEPFLQWENLNGKPATNAYVEVYLAGTNTKYITYQNFDGTRNPFQIIIPSDGRTTILGDVSYTYDVYFYSSNGNLICSRLNISPNVPGNVSISGKATIIESTDGTVQISAYTDEDNIDRYDLSVSGTGSLYEVIHDETLSGNGTIAQPLGVSPLTNLAVDDTLTAYTATISGEESLVLGVNSDLLSGTMQESGLSFNENDEITAYNGSAFAGNGGIEYSAGANIDITNNVISGKDWSDEINDKLDTTSFSTVSSTFLTAHQDISNKLDTTAFSTVSGTFLTAHQDISNKLDTTAFSDVSGNFALTSDIPDVSNKLDTTAFSTVSGTFLTAHQSIPSSGNWNDTYETVSTNSAQWGIGISYTAGANINITNDVISGRDWSNEINTKQDTLSNNQLSAISSVSSKQDTLTFNYLDI